MLEAILKRIAEWEQSLRAAGLWDRGDCFIVLKIKEAVYKEFSGT
jgi:hypothetical protein